MVALAPKLLCRCALANARLARSLLLRPVWRANRAIRTLVRFGPFGLRSFGLVWDLVLSTWNFRPAAHDSLRESVRPQPHGQSKKDGRLTATACVEAEGVEEEFDDGHDGNEVELDEKERAEV